MFAGKATAHCMPCRQRRDGGFCRRARGNNAEGRQDAANANGFGCAPVAGSATTAIAVKLPRGFREAENLHARCGKSERFWLLDPLDGTKEFISDNEEFTVNIALGEEGQSVLSVVYAPANDLLYWGGPGLGA